MAEKEILTREILLKEAELFCVEENRKQHLLNLNDEKSIGTYIEHSFKDFLKVKYSFTDGNSALGVDFPDSNINTDIKSTSIAKPQSSCSYKNPGQKIYGLGFSLIIFIYEKIKVGDKQRIIFKRVSFIEESRTADYTTTKLLNDILDKGYTKNDIIDILKSREISEDIDVLNNLAEAVILNRPKQGYLTISDAMQLRLKYTKITELRENVDGITRLKIKE